MRNTPKVSLVMKVYNGEKYLRDAIDSILCQTYGDFELLIIDDASVDSSAEIVKSYTDPRIRFFQNEQNLGLCKTQNNVIAQARGEFVAVMDCDDISYPTRFEKQVAFLESHPDVILCGSYRNDLVDGVESPCGDLREISPQTLKFSLFFGNFYITHSSIMFRRKQYREDNIQYGDVPIAEDYAVITKMAAGHPVALLAERLVAYRISGDSISKKRAKELEESANRVKCNFLETTNLSPQDKQFLQTYFLSGRAEPDLQRFIGILQMLAEETGADIAPGGEAHGIACMQVLEYVLRCKRYRYALWRTLQSCPYQDGVSLKTVTGWKIWIACVIRYHRK